MIIPSFYMLKAIKEYHRWKVDLRSGIKISEILQQTVRMSEKLCLQWNDFKENVNSAFGRLRDDKEFTDVTLACDDGQMEAHKVILAASSPFFEKQTPTSTDLLERVSVSRPSCHPWLSLLWWSKCFSRELRLLPCHCWGTQTERTHWPNIHRIDEWTGKSTKPQTS